MYRLYWTESMIRIQDRVNSLQSAAPVISLLFHHQLLQHYTRFLPNFVRTLAYILQINKLHSFLETGTKRSSYTKMKNIMKASYPWSIFYKVQF